MKLSPIRNTVLEECRAIARLIAGESNPPEALVHGLFREIPFVTAYRESDESTPKRADHKDHLKQVEKAALKISMALTDWKTLVFLINAEDGDLGFNADDTAKAMDEIVIRAKNAGKAIPDGGGPHRAVPQYHGQDPLYIDAKELCALIIVQSWILTRGAKPSRANDRAHEAADRYWIASGGTSIGAGETLSGWERWIKKAKLLLDLPARDPRTSIVRQLRYSLGSLDPDLIAPFFAN